MYSRKKYQIKGPLSRKAWWASWGRAYTHLVQIYTFKSIGDKWKCAQWAKLELEMTAAQAGSWIATVWETQVHLGPNSSFTENVR